MPDFGTEPLSPSPEAVRPVPGAPGAYGTALPDFGAVPPRLDEYDSVPPLSQGERVLNTFFAPSRTFADIRRDRSWWLPYLLLVVFSLIFGAVIHSRVDADTLAENAVRSNPSQTERMQNASPEQRAQMMKFTSNMMAAGIFSGPITSLLFPAIMALLIWVGCNFILGGSSTFPGMFAVAMYAALPGLVLYVILIAALLAGDPETFNLANPAGTNLGYYMPVDMSPPLRSLLTSLDLFSVWQVFLLGLGGAIVARVKTSTTLGMVFGAWVLVVLVKAALAAL